jgi:putative zinc finger/helix-turn-helix YgiT family protein
LSHLQPVLEVYEEDVMEQCAICGGALTVVKDKPYAYTQSGLNVILLGIPQYSCESCGEKFTPIPSPENLHKVIALDICKNKKALLLPEEIKFLRKELHLKAKELARVMGINPSVISRWENGKAPIGEGSDRLLRAICLAGLDDSCQSDNHVAKTVNTFLSLPRDRKHVREPHAISLNPSEWMGQTACHC